jgi:heat-inducible transcriptional repressor
MQALSRSISNQRGVSILRALVEEYIDTAAPVASESIARRSAVKVSPATIRNKMAELEEEGYIVRPHISSGGVPSDKGYRFYVESLEEGLEPPLGLQREIMQRFGSVERDLEAWMKLASVVLSDLSDNMAVVTYPRSPSPRVKNIQIVHLQDFLAMLIVVLEETRLRKHLIPLEDLYTQGDLTSVANKLNAAYSGLTYRDILEKTVEFTPFEELVRQDTLGILKGYDEEQEIDHTVDGLRLLLAQPEFEDREKALGVAEMLDERLLIRSILSQASEAGDVAVHIGQENSEESLKPFSVVLCHYGVPEDATGVVTVLGPTRMEYSNVIGGVRFMSSFMSELVTSVRGG